MGATISGGDAESDTGATGTRRRDLLLPSPRYYRKSGTAYGRFNPPPLRSIVASIILSWIAFSGGWGFSLKTGGAYAFLVLLPFAAMMGQRRVFHLSLDAGKHVVRVIYGIGIVRITLPLRNVIGFVTPENVGGTDNRRKVYLQVRLRSGGKEYIPPGKHNHNDMRALFQETSAIVGRELPVTVAGEKQQDD